MRLILKKDIIIKAGFEFDENAHFVKHNIAPYGNVIGFGDEHIRKFIIHQNELLLFSDYFEEIDEN